MQAAPPGKSVASWMFDVLVISVGCVLALVALVTFAAADPAVAAWTPALALGVSLIVLIGWFPLVVSGNGLGVEVGFEAAVLIALVLHVGTSGALAIWVVAQAASTLTTRKRPDVRLFNFGLGVTGGAIAVAVLEGTGQLGRTTPGELAAVGLGCAAYFANDYLVSAASSALEERRSVLQDLRNRDGLLAGLVSVGVWSLGYLAALVMRALPVWSGVLLAGPLVTILVASRALSRGREHQRRLTALFEASTAVQGTGTVDELVEVLHHQAGLVIGRRSIAWQDEPPVGREVGVDMPGDVRGPGGARWLVTPGADLTRASARQDRRALGALVGVAGETTARLRLVDRLAEQARHDSLTGLPNRLMLTERLQERLSEPGGRGGVAVLYLDLDGFKSVNDRFGHSGGDDLLRRVAGRLAQIVGPSDTVARLGGDEFAILLADVENLQQVERCCDQVLATVRIPVSLAGHDVVVGTSIGVSLPTAETALGAGGAGELMRNADMAMYRAKAQGKNEYVVYQHSLGEDRIRRLELVEALRAGIRTELVVHYQPLVDLATGRITGVEALVRWQRGSRLLSPDAFIPAAEDSGLVVALGHEVLRQVVLDGPRLVEAAGGPLDIAVNMSATQLQDGEFALRVRAAAEALGRSRLVLEMTETVLVADDPHTVQTLHRLTAAGARLAIDDFGVGYSSIGYLQHLPIDMIKIDRSFVRDIESVPRARALVESILVMGAALELDVIAEGIERRGQADLLRAAGCAQGQGYLFAHPQPLEACLEALRRGVPSHMGR
jgi:diguanylate cyclase (GGDEF)-like protein